MFKNGYITLSFLLFYIVNLSAQTLLKERFGVTLRLQEPYSDGITTGNYYAFDWDSFVPTKNLNTVDWTESDWYGNWTTYDMSYTHINHPPAPGTPDNDWYPSGAEKYDVEAIYFDNDADSFYIAIVTSIPHYKDYGGGITGVGIYESSRISSWDHIWIRPGDISLNLFEGTARNERNGTQWHYNYGVNLVHENRDNLEWVNPPGMYTTTLMRDNSVGTEFYSTGYDAGGSDVEDPTDSDWYTSTPGGNVEAYWEHTNFDPLSTISQNLGIAQFLGNAGTNYYLYTFPAFGTHSAGELENNYDTWIVEASIPRTLLGVNNPGDGDQVGIQFMPGCRNDGDAIVASIELHADFDDRYDYGDAPDPNFPTLLSSNGARHFITEGIYLGSGVDDDNDGQGTATVDGDDNDGNDDEDGVSFTSPLMQSSDNSITVVASAAGYLNAWMDFNQDGDWDDAEEQIFTNQLLSPGSNNLTISVPLITTEGTIREAGIVSRFRFSTEQDLSYTGPAIDGEVEDYTISILIPVELRGFNVSSHNGTVKISWTTATETNNAGFNIYRSESENGSFERINTQLISGAGNSESTRQYTFTDNTVEPGKTYYYKLGDSNLDGTVTMHMAHKVDIAMPKAYMLEQNYPNPFNPSTQIDFTLKEAGMTELRIYNLQGQLVKTLVNNVLPSGQHSHIWLGKDDNNRSVPSGTYLYKITVNNFTATKKLTLMK